MSGSVKKVKAVNKKDDGKFQFLVVCFDCFKTIGHVLGEKIPV